MADNASGIDVSHHQGPIDWAKVAASGIAFAFAKATEGTSTDIRFQENWTGMKAAGVLRGAYHFFRPSVDVKKQAQHFCDVVGVLDPGDLPPVLDLEPAGPPSKGDEWSAVAAGQRVELVQRWFDAVSGLGKTPLLYTYGAFWRKQFESTADLADHPLWIAQYKVKSPTLVGWTEWTFWQHSDRGTCEGIQGKVDLDLYVGSVADLKGFVNPAD